MGTLVFISALLFSVSVFGQTGVTYHGRLITPSGVPVTSSLVRFKIQIRSPGAENCLLFEEEQVQDLSVTNGAFALDIGSTPSYRKDTTGLSFDRIFSNQGSFNVPGNCVLGNSYAPGFADARKIEVSFNDGSFVGWEPMPTQAINYVPKALDSLQVGGFRAEHLLRVESSGVPQSVPSMTSSDFTEMMKLILGTSTQYTKAGQLNGSALPSLSNGQSLGWNGSAWTALTPLTSSSLPNCNPGEVLKSNGGVLSCVTDTTGGTPADATTSSKGIVQISATGGIDVNAGVIRLSDTGTAGTYYKVTTDAKGRVASGASSLIEADIPNLTTAGKVSGSAINAGTIGGNASINTSGNITTSGSVTGTTSMSTQNLRIFESTNTYRVSFVAHPSMTGNYGFVLPAALPLTSGQVLGSDTSGNLSWVTPSTGSVTSVSGTAPISVTGTSTPTVSIAQAGSASNGYLSSTDWNTFNNKLGTSSSLSGDVTGTPSATTIANNAVNSAKIVDGSVGVVDLDFAGAMAINTGLVVRNGSQFFNKVCSGNETLIWTVSNGWSCSAVVLSESDPKVGANTTNYLSKWNGSALVASGVYESSGNVGIGTTTPGAELDVNGTIRATQICDRLGSNCKTVSSGWSGGSGGTTANIASKMGLDPALWPDAIKCGTAPYGAVYQLGFRHGSTNAVYYYAEQENYVSYDSSTGNYYTGADGTGGYYVTGCTASMAAIMAAGRGIYYGTSVQAQWADGDATAPGASFTGDTNTGLFRAGADIFGFATAGSERMRINATGSVGIGTISPSEKLEVVGNIKGTQLCIGVDCRNSWPTADLTNLNASNLSSGTLPTARLPAFTGDVTSVAGSNSITLNTVPISKGGTGQTTATAALNALLPSQGSNSGRVLQTDGTNATWVAQTESDPKVGANTTNYLSKWNGSALVSSGVYESGGNIGIGTASPGQKLSVAGTIESTSGGIKFPDGTTQTTAFAGSDVSPIRQTKSITNLSVYSTASTTYVNTGITGITLANNLQTTSSKVRIRVSGIFDANTNEGVEVTIYDGTTYLHGSKTGLASLVSAGSYHPHNFSFEIVDSNITSTTPKVYQLRFKSGSGDTVYLGRRYFDTNVSNPTNIVIEEVNEGGVSGGNIIQVNWNESGSNVYRASGNVGIGTTSPAAALDVDAVQTIDGLTANMISRSSGTATGIQLVGSAGKSAIQTQSGDIVFWSDNQTAGNNWIAGDEKMRITTTGNVGIGTTAPTAKLHIAGTPGTDGIRFPDGTLQTTASSGSAGAVNLYNNAHTSTDCVAAYGLVRNTPSGYLCQFTGSACPSGWTRLSNWGVTHARSIPQCGTDSHEFANIATETCSYMDDGWPVFGTSASVKAVGCY